MKLHFLNPLQKLKWLIYLFFMSFYISSCGNISTGTTPIPNDSSPDGTLLVQGSFVGQNGKTVTGVAMVYLGNETGENIIRLSGISTPNETGLKVIASANGDTVYQGTLRNTSGTQNYSTSVSIRKKWNSVSIESSTQNLNYGTAILE